MKEYISCNQAELFAETDSGTIQNAIAAAVEDGCRRIVIPRYNLRTDKNEWRIDKAIEVPSEMTVLLDNCYLVQETGVYDNMFRNARAYAEKRTLENEDHDISILGIGNVCLSGGVHNGLLERNAGKYGLPPSFTFNQMLLWINVRDLRVENIHFEHQRHWAINHIYCRNVKLKNLDFFAYPHVPNMDGIDLRVGCHDFEIENITGKTGDDTIAMTAMMGGTENFAYVEGKETDICNVKIKNVLSDPFRMLNVRVLTQDGVQVHDIDVDTVMDTSDWETKVFCKAALGLGTQGALYVKLCRAKPGDLSHITARNIYTRGSIALRIDDACADSTFTNVKTFSTCFTGIGTVGFGCVLKNITVDGLYYGSNKTDRQRGWVDGYQPSAVVRMPQTTGELLVKNVYSDGMEYLCQGTDGLNVTFENCDMTNVNAVTDCKGQATITVNGEVYQGD
jgi:hypothetical protein